MAQFLAQRWRRQPQGPVAVDWGNPLARGLVLAFNAGNPYRNLAGQNEIAENDPLFPGKRQITRFGIGYWTDFGAGAGSTQYLNALPAAKVPTGKYVAITLGYKKSDATFRASSAFGTGSPINCHLPWSDGAVYWDWSTLRVSVSGLTFGDDVWTFQSNATGLQIAQNGASQIQGTTQASAIGASANPFLIGKGGSSPDVAITSFLYMHDRPLAEAEWKALHDNPWQLFRAPRPIIYSLPSGSTVPALSSPTAINITTTGATPRVTLTF